MRVLSLVRSAAPCEENVSRCEETTSGDEETHVGMKQPKLASDEH